MSYTPRLKEKYRSEIVKTLTDQFGYKSSMRVPRLSKIDLSIVIGEEVAEKKNIEGCDL